VLFLIALVVFVILMVWLLPRLWRLIKAMFRRVGSWLGLCDPAPAVDDDINSSSQAAEAAPPHIENHHDAEHKRR
jgi:hypothetical protein